jgi:aminopeptidase N
MEDGAGLDLGALRGWYEQAGTPRVMVALSHAGDRATLRLTQTVPPTPGQPDKRPMPLPLRLALFDRETATHRGEQLVMFEGAETEVGFDGFAAPPVLSVNRGFSAPVAIAAEIAEADLVFLAAHDDDPFARYEAMQSLVVRHLVAEASGTLDEAAREAGRTAIGQALGAAIADAQLDDLMRGELMILPAESYIAEQLDAADPQAIRTARESLKAWLGRSLHEPLVALHRRAAAVPYGRDAAARGARKVKTQSLVYLAAAAPQEAAALAAAQYDGADNMTDRQGALMVLAGLDVPERESRLADFHRRQAGNALVIDKWFSLQAGSLHPDALAQVRALAAHPDFTMANPNRVRALYMALAVNAGAFHAADGAGYRMIADLILALDPLNPQTAARFVPSLGRWRRIEPVRAALMRAELERIAAAPALSRDTREQVTKSLG